MVKVALKAPAVSVAGKGLAAVVAVGREVGKGGMVTTTTTTKEKKMRVIAAPEAAATGVGGKPLKTAVRAAAVAAKAKGSSGGAAAKVSTTTTPLATAAGPSAGGGAATAIAARPAAGGPTVAVGERGAATAAAAEAERPRGGTRWRTQGRLPGFNLRTTCSTRRATKTNTTSGAEGAATIRRAKTVKKLTSSLLLSLKQSLANIFFVYKAFFSSIARWPPFLFPSLKINPI